MSASSFDVHYQMRRVTHEGKRCWAIQYRDVAEIKVARAPHKLNQYQAEKWFIDTIVADEAWQQRNRVADTGVSMLCKLPGAAS